LYAEIKAVETQPGRPGIDPPILMTLWLYATLEGVGSARALDRMCDEHNAYAWICGGVGVNYHTLSDFRVRHIEFLDDLLTRSVAALMMNGTVTLNRVAQDGVRVRANAGSGSYRRRKRLNKFLEIADEQVQRLRRELEEDPAASENRQQAAKRRVALERQKRVTQALDEMEQIEARYAARNAHGNKRKKPPPDATGPPPQDKREPRVSTTDPQARTMKGADGGFRPSYNVQFATDTASGIIVGVDVINRGNDWEELPVMLDQLHRRYGRCPAQSLVDGGFAKFDAVVAAESRGTQVFAPIPRPKNAKLDPHQPRSKEPQAITQWRLRMATNEAKQIYRERAASAEWVNAQARNRGLRQFLVRGMAKARAVVLWYALAHNLMQLQHLTVQAEPA
jgi:transposase